ncbi:hypothetical protein K437DRAFT_270651 [Tilletiaria anomala UBC 951]|uniref:COQ9 domain-containing protein n=1 Tax=Tilletiaria anomala (strain ATCC 24038 / CBS 436.72 / UBC 951) TaxID=1037660 RepID=A0A066VHA2_TILAU|nr:uncharacterized protein K437DRAFT_270651 [Tilletiaria anomala UBC 951]KDN38144.1 hypothetical protein K437DRAFT_270651 [Tilletiaria anomala UBC 951]
MAATKLSPSLSSRVLTASVPHIPAHGFSVRAAQAAAAASVTTRGGKTASGSKTDIITPQEGRLLQDSPQLILSLASGTASHDGETSFAKCLFHRWDELSLESTVERSQTIMRTSKGKEREMDRSAASYGDLVSALEQRLLISAEAKIHLLAALSAESSLSIGQLSQFLPPNLAGISSLLPSGMPTPAPLAHRSWRLADELGHRLGWKDSSFGPAWYAHRGRLSLAYLLAEIHLASPISEPNASPSFYEAEHTDTKTIDEAAYQTLDPPHPEQVQRAAAPSIQLLRRIAWGKDTSFVADIQRALHVAGNISQWAGRGWLGVFRSRGL